MTRSRLHSEHLRYPRLRSLYFVLSGYLTDLRYLKPGLPVCSYSSA